MYENYPINIFYVGIIGGLMFGIAGTIIYKKIRQDNIENWPTIQFNVENDTQLHYALDVARANKYVDVKYYLKVGPGEFVVNIFELEVPPNTSIKGAGKDSTWFISGNALLLEEWRKEPEIKNNYTN